MDGGQLHKLSSQVEEFSRPGVDGVGFRVKAKKAPTGQKHTFEGVTLLANANASAEAYEAIKGTLVTVIDDSGRTVTNVMVIDVQVMRVTATLLSVPAGNNYLVEAVWTLKATT